MRWRCGELPWIRKRDLRERLAQAIGRHEPSRSIEASPRMQFVGRLVLLVRRCRAVAASVAIEGSTAPIRWLT